MKLSDIEPGYASYEAAREGNFEKFLKNSEFVDHATCLEIINKGQTEYFPLLRKSLNKYYHSVPNFFMLKLYYYDLKTLKNLLPYLNLKLKDKIDNQTILFQLDGCNLELFKLFFDEFKRRRIPVDDEILCHYIKKNEIQIVDFLKGYIRIRPKHIKCALELGRPPHWFAILRTNSKLYPEFLIDAAYNPEIFELIFKKLRIVDCYALQDFKTLFYDEKIMRKDFAVKFLLDEDVPKPPLDYLTISPLNLDKYYEFELKFIQKLFSEEGIGRIVKSYILP